MTPGGAGSSFGGRGRGPTLGHSRIGRGGHGRGRVVLFVCWRRWGADLRRDHQGSLPPLLLLVGGGLVIVEIGPRLVLAGQALVFGHGVDGGGGDLERSVSGRLLGCGQGGCWLLVPGLAAAAAGQGDRGSGGHER